MYVCMYVCMYVTLRIPTHGPRFGGLGPENENSVRPRLTEQAMERRVPEDLMKVLKAPEKEKGL